MYTDGKLSGAKIMSGSPRQQQRVCGRGSRARCRASRRFTMAQGPLFLCAE